MLPLKVDSPDGLRDGDIVVLYSPYMPNDPLQESTVVPMAIPPVQQQVGTFFDLYQFPAVSTPFAAVDIMGSGRKELAGVLQMNPLYAVARVDICVMQPAFTGQKIEYVSFSSEGLAGEFHYDLAAKTPGLPLLETDSVKTEVSDLAILSPGKVARVYMAIAPGVHSGILLVKTETMELTIPVQETDFPAATVTPIEVFVQGDIVGDNETFDSLEGFDWLN